MARIVFSILVCLFGFGCLYAIAEPVEQRKLVAIGEARNPDNGSLVYLEYHYEHADKVSASVDYIRPSKVPIAKKTLNFTRSTIAPSFQIKDLRFEQTLEARWQGKGLMLGRSGGAKQQSRTLKTNNKELVVVDAGFDQFIREHWTQLSQDDTISFQFAVPVRLSTVKLKARQHSCSKGMTDRKCFIIKASNPLIGLVLPPIELEYSLNERKLLSFKGLSNLDSDQRGGQQVHISYRYVEDLKLGCDNSAGTGTPITPTANIEDCIVATRQGQGKQINAGSDTGPTITDQLEAFML